MYHNDTQVISLALISSFICVYISIKNLWCKLLKIFEWKKRKKVKPCTPTTFEIINELTGMWDKRIHYLTTVTWHAYVISKHMDHALMNQSEFKLLNLKLIILLEQYLVVFDVVIFLPGQNSALNDSHSFRFAGSAIVLTTDTLW